MGAYDNDIAVGAATDVMSVTPSDSTAVFFRQLFITGAGTLKIDTLDTVGRTLTVPANFTLTCVVKKVWATGTAATGIIGYA